MEAEFASIFVVTCVVANVALMPYKAVPYS